MPNFKKTQNKKYKKDPLKNTKNDPIFIFLKKLALIESLSFYGLNKP